MTATMGRTSTATCAATLEIAKAERVNLLGFDVTWSLKGVQVQRDDLRIALREAGLERYLPEKPPTAKRTLKRAIVMWARQRGLAGLENEDEDDGEDTVSARRNLVREVPVGREGDSGPNAVMLALVQEEALARALRLRYATSHRFYYVPAPGGIDEGKLTVSTRAAGDVALGESRAIESELRPLWERYRLMYLAGDVSRIVAAVIEDWGAYKLRDGGGAYHVGVERAGDLDKLARFVSALPVVDRYGRVPRVNAHAVPDWPATRNSLQELAYETILGEVKDATWTLERAEKQNTTKSGSVRKTTLENLLNAFEVARKRVESVASTVGMRDERELRLMADLATYEERARALAPNDLMRQERTVSTAGRDGRAELVDLGDADARAHRMEREF